MESRIADTSTLVRWFAAAIVLLLAAAAPSLQPGTASAHQVVHAVQASGIYADGSCVIGPDSSSCSSTGSVELLYDPVIPLNASNIRYRVELNARATPFGAATYSIVVAPEGEWIGNYVTAAATSTPSTYGVGPNTFQYTWTPYNNVHVMLSHLSGATVNWSNIVLKAYYDLPDVADLQVTASVPTPAGTGSSVPYTVTVANDGPQPAHNVSLSTTLGANLVHLTTTGCLAGYSNYPTCELGTIAANSSKTVTINVLVPLNASGSRTSSFTATSAVATDPVAGNNTATLSIGIFKMRNITVCQEWIANADGVTEPASSWEFEVDWVGKPSPGTFALTPAEGSEHCGTIGIPDFGTTLVRQLPKAGFTNAAGYPTWQINDSGILTVGTDAGVRIGATKVTFTSKRAYTAPTATATATATATPTATSTKTPAATTTPTRTPASTSTPVPGSTATAPPAVTATPPSPLPSPGDPVEQPPGAANPPAGGSGPSSGEPTGEEGDAPEESPLEEATPTPATASGNGSTGDGTETDTADNEPETPAAPEAGSGTAQGSSGVGSTTWFAIAAIAGVVGIIALVFARHRRADATG